MTPVLVIQIERLVLKMKKQPNTPGFSLIEILISIAIIITATTVVVAMLSSSFRGISKSNVSEEVRQNGNRAISQMSRTIQFAESFLGASVDGVAYKSCVGGAGTNYQFIKIRSGGGDVILSCNNLTIDGTSLIDTTRVKVVGGSCSFKCTRGSDIDSPIIGITFQLSQKSATVPEKSQTIPFSTTVKVRNR